MRKGGGVTRVGTETFRSGKRPKNGGLGRENNLLGTKSPYAIEQREEGAAQGPINDAEANCDRGRNKSAMRFGEWVS